MGVWQEYYRGNLVNDRAHKPKLGHMADAMWDRYARGEIVMAQVRLEPGLWSYVYQPTAAHAPRPRT